MKKNVISMLCGALVVTMAIPALAEVTVNGYFRTQGIVQTSADTKGYFTPTKDYTEQFVVQRFRAKITNKLNDLVSLVYFAEVDTNWGCVTDPKLKAVDATGADTDTIVSKAGGNVGADGINVETKNVYADLKPSKDFPVSFRVGIQTLQDDLQGVYLYDDAAAVVAMGQFDALSVNLGWSKYAEEKIDQQDDKDLYFAKVGMKANDTTNFGLDLFYTDDMKAKETLYTIAPFFNVGLGAIGVDGFLAYQGGKNDDKDLDYSSYVASVNASVKLDPATLGLRVIYMSGQGDSEDTCNIFQGDQGVYSFYNEGLNIFLADVMKTDFANDRGAIYAQKQGFGLLGAVAKAKVDFAPAYAKVAIGYFTTLNDDAGTGEAQIDGKTLGTEIAAEVGTKVAEIATVSLRGSYAMLGNAYNGFVDGEDPDNAYMVALMLNVPY